MPDPISTWIDPCDTFVGANWSNSGVVNVIASGGRHIFPTSSTGPTNGIVEGNAFWDLTTGTAKDYAVVLPVPSGQVWGMQWLNGLGTGVGVEVYLGEISTFKTIYNAGSAVVGHGPRDNVEEKVFWCRYSTANGGSLLLEVSSLSGIPVTLATFLVSDLVAGDGTFTPTAITRKVRGGNPDFGIADSDPNVEVEGYNVGWTTDPIILLTPSSRTFNAEVGGSTPSSQTVTITNDGGGTLTPVLGAVTGTAATYLSRSLLNGVVTITPTSVPATAGTYTYAIEVSSAGASNTPQSITGSYIVAATAPVLSASPADPYTLATRAGSGVSATQTVTFTNTGTGTITPSVVSVTGPGAAGIQTLFSGNVLTITNTAVPATTAPVSQAFSVTVGSPGATNVVLTGTRRVLRRSTGGMQGILRRGGVQEGIANHVSADPSVATVNATTGLITAVGPGTTTVTASGTGVVSKSRTVIVETDAT